MGGQVYAIKRWSLHHIDMHSETSPYMLNLPNSPNIFPIFYKFELSSAPANNASLFLSCTIPKPSPVMTSEGYEEQVMDERLRHAIPGMLKKLWAQA